MTGSTKFSCGHTAEAVCGECYAELQKAAKQLFTLVPDMTPEERGDVLFACRQIARKTEREAGQQRLPIELRMKKMARADRLRSAIRKLKPRG